MCVLVYVYVCGTEGKREKEIDVVEDKGEDRKREWRRKQKTDETVEINKK